MSATISTFKVGNKQHVAGTSTIPYYKRPFSYFAAHADNMTIDCSFYKRKWRKLYYSRRFSSPFEIYMSYPLLYTGLITIMDIKHMRINLNTKQHFDKEKHFIFFIIIVIYFLTYNFPTSQHSYHNTFLIHILK